MIQRRSANPSSYARETEKGPRPGGAVKAPAVLSRNGRGTGTGSTTTSTSSSPTTTQAGTPRRLLVLTCVLVLLVVLVHERR